MIGALPTKDREPSRAHSYFFQIEFLVAEGWYLVCEVRNEQKIHTLKRN